METSRPEVPPRNQARYEPNLKLRRARESRGWAQADVAERIGAQANLVTRWERGYAFPSPYYRQKLCSLFDISAEALGLVKEEKQEHMEEPSLPDIPQRCEEPPLEEAESMPVRPGTKRWLVSRRSIALGLFVGLAAGGIGLWRSTYVQPSLPSPTPIIPNPLIATYHTSPATSVNDVAWSPHGTLIACANGNKTLQIIEAATTRSRLTYREHHGFVNSVCWSPDQRWVASASADTTVQIWNPSNGSRTLTYSGHTASVWCVAWSPDGTSLASGGRNPTIQVWEANSGKLSTMYHGHTGGVWMVAWSPDGQSIASCGEDGTIQVWSALTGKASDTFRYGGDRRSTLYEVAWSPDGKLLASASADATVHIWDALTGGHQLTCQGHTASVQTVKWSPNGKLLASGSLDGTVRIWQARTGKQLSLYPYHNDEVYAVSWSPDGHLLASGSRDTTMQIYQVASL